MVLLLLSVYSLLAASSPLGRPKSERSNRGATVLIFLRIRVTVEIDHHDRSNYLAAINTGRPTIHA